MMYLWVSHPPKIDLPTWLIPYCNTEMYFYPIFWNDWLQPLNWMTAEFKKQSRRTSKYASVFITQSLLYSGELQTNPIPSRKCKTNTWRRLSHCLKITQNVAFEFLHFGIFHQFFLNSNIGTLIPPKSFENYSNCRIRFFNFGIFHQFLSY